MKTNSTFHRDPKTKMLINMDETSYQHILTLREKNKIIKEHDERLKNLEKSIKELLELGKK